MIAQFPHTRSTATIIPFGSKIHVFANGKHYTLSLPLSLEEGEGGKAAGADRLVSPMPATVIEVRVKPGDQVTEGQVCAVLESMKMEISIRAGRDGVIGSVNVEKGQVVEEGAVLVALSSTDEHKFGRVAF
jgi:3-methylcrotonyl-CoA carboxylase alpha subunit